MKYKEVSAFRLFYDEFIYKEDPTIVGVLGDFRRIKENLLKVRKCSKKNVSIYMHNLDFRNKIINYHLDRIAMINPSVFEYFYVLYKSRMALCNDKLEDMPFIVSCSFYNDYRIDNKDEKEWENNEFLVPKYSSLDKKSIRDTARGKSKLDYFILLLQDGDSYRYAWFVNKVNYLKVKLKPVVSETHYDYFNRVSNALLEIKHLIERLKDKALMSDDYQIISEKMEIAYHHKFSLEFDEIYNLLTDYFDNLYNEVVSLNEFKQSLTIKNTISYEEYKDRVSDLVKEKEKYIKKFKNEKVDIDSYDNSFINQFKVSLMKYFFDERLIDKKCESLEESVNRAISFYELAQDLERQLFEKITFDATYSSDLGRNHDVVSALLIKIYDLYSPFITLDKYEELRMEFEKKLNKKNVVFLKEYETLLSSLKLKYDYHGPIPSKKIILLKINEMKKKFLFDNCITDLKNRDVTNVYDTRNYDLTVIVQGLTIDDLVEIYDKMKFKIEKYDFSNLRFLDKSIGEDEYEKNKMLKFLQELIVKQIFKNLYKDKMTKEEENNRYKDICFAYLKEKCLFESENSDSNRSKNSLLLFLDAQLKYEKNSKWNLFCKENKLIK